MGLPPPLHLTSRPRVRRRNLRAHARARKAPMYIDYESTLFCASRAPLLYVGTMCNACAPHATPPSLPPPSLGGGATAALSANIAKIGCFQPRFAPIFGSLILRFDPYHIPPSRRHPFYEKKTFVFLYLCFQDSLFRIST